MKPAAQGYQAARLADIAVRADLTTGAIYSIAGSKHGLLLAALQRMIDGQVEAVAALADPELSLPACSMSRPRAPIGSPPRN
ncbi:TetR/AcrR family transcriptional regulator [Nocardia brasiliensis]|uniref:TetR/AcrR family transcriptional regulator n=1 Tax=Nocardia brasiliensis TaxID=37326 RepID=UPI003D76E111